MIDPRIHSPFYHALFGEETGSSVVLVCPLHLLFKVLCLNMNKYLMTHFSYI